MKLIAEVIIVGFIFAVIGSILTYGFSGQTHADSMGSVFAIFFLTGAIGHVLFEALGANAWYCKNGNACQKK